jgi:hypothetical protein
VNFSWATATTHLEAGSSMSPDSRRPSRYPEQIVLVQLVNIPWFFTYFKDDYGNESAME